MTIHNKVPETTAPFVITYIAELLDSRLTNTDLRLLLLLRHRQGQNDSAWCSCLTLAEDLGVTERAIKYSMARLTELNFIVCEKRGFGKSSHKSLLAPSSVYDPVVFSKPSRLMGASRTALDIKRLRSEQLSKSELLGISSPYEPYLEPDYDGLDFDDEGIVVHDQLGSTVHDQRGSTVHDLSGSTVHDLSGTTVHPNKNHVTTTSEQKPDQQEPFEEAPRSAQRIPKIDLDNKKTNSSIPSSTTTIEYSVTTGEVVERSQRAIPPVQPGTDVVLEDRLDSIKTALQPILHPENYASRIRAMSKIRSEQCKQSNGGEAVGRNKRSTTGKPGQFDENRYNTAESAGDPEYISPKPITSTNMEKIWRLQYRDRYPHLTWEKWSVKEKKFVADMLKTYGETKLAKAFDYIFERWEKYRTSHSWKKLGPAPVIDFLYAERRNIFADIESTKAVQDQTGIGDGKKFF